MATFHATFMKVQNKSSRGAELAVGVGNGAIGTAALTTSSSAAIAQRASTNWTAPSDGYVTCFCDGNVRAAVGETAVSGTSPVGHFVPANAPYTISISAGQSLSVIDA